MTLKEKFLPFVDWNDLQEYYVNRDWAIRNAERCEKIADEFAINFAEWIDDIRIDRKILYDTRSIKELLEIFKKEKGL